MLPWLQLLWGREAASENRLQPWALRMLVPLKRLTELMHFKSQNDSGRRVLPLAPF